MVNQLLDFINTTFSATDARDTRCFAQLIRAIIKERTVNLAKLALHCFHTSRRPEARYRRLQRFIARSPITQASLASVIMTFFQGPQLLALDRTNWAFGSFQINILVLSVIYKGFGFPLFWTLLPHQGCCSATDRIDLMKTFIQRFGCCRIQALVMDREFIGPQWLQFLNQEGIIFHVRLKNNIKIARGKGELRSPIHGLSRLKVFEKIDLPGLRKIGTRKEGLKLFVSITRSPCRELVIVGSNQESDQALERYKLRWGIETLFGCLKTRGFYLEDTHLKDQKKISNLLVLLSFAFFWAFRIGEWLNEKAPIILKSHNRKSISLFRYGLNALIQVGSSFVKFLLAPLFFPTPKPPPKKLLISLGYV